MTDEANKPRQSTSDALGRLVQVIEAPGALNFLTSYTYDALGNLKQVLQSSQTRTFTYDSLSRLRTAANPESGTNTYTYDDNANLLTKLDARSITTQIDYDALNRPTVKTYTDGTPTVRYCYDGFDYDAVSGACTGSQVVGKKGRLTATGSAVSVTRFTAFDDLGRISASQQSTAGGDYNFIYGYNLAGGLEVQQYPSGRQVETCYDSAGRIDGLTNLGGPSAYASNFSYAPHGVLAQLTLGNNLVETTSFNNRLQPFKIQAGGLLTLDFEYNTLGQTDNNGNVLTQKIDAPGLPAMLTQTYTYDGVNRLASITETGGSTNWNRAYSYDAYGNRAATGANVFANTPQSLADFDAATNRLTATWAGYDVAGNLTSFNKPGFEWTAAYDADNLQSSFTSGSTTTTYHYDGAGRRLKKLQGSRTTVFVYDAFGNLAAEYDTQPDLNLVAGTYYRTTDHLGSTRLVTDGSGAVVSRRDYFPFGEEIPANATFGNRQLVSDGGPATIYNKEFGVYQKFTGKERDGESALDYFDARYYSSTQGRFASPDPISFDVLRVINPERWNRYTYAVNNPLLFIDPDGRDAIAVNFTDPALGLGHQAVVVVRLDGSATFGDFGPSKELKFFTPSGNFRVFDFDPVSFDISGLPTEESMRRMRDQIAYETKEPASTISFAYFKTSVAETAALDAYLQNASSLEAAGDTTFYLVGVQDCIAFCVAGLNAAGVGSGPLPLGSIPNRAIQLQMLAAHASFSGASGKRKVNSVGNKEEVTSTVTYCSEGNSDKCKGNEQ